jgi:hypothetical protein
MFSVDGFDWSTNRQDEQDIGSQLFPDCAYELAVIAAEHNEALRWNQTMYDGR